MKKNYNGFTLSEVLITIGIIGIIAAMTLPVLIGNYKKKETVTKLKKIYTVLSQLVILSQEDNGPASFSTKDKVDANTVKNFFEIYWRPYLNAPTIAKSGETFYQTKGFIYKQLNGNIYDTGIYTSYANGRVLFQIYDGTIYFLCMMYWETIHDDDGNLISQTAKYAPRQTVFVDINGTKNPNTFGKDIFIFSIDFDNNTVKPLGYNYKINTLNKNCSKSGTGSYCAAKIMADNWKIKNDYPW